MAVAVAVGVGCGPAYAVCWRAQPRQHRATNLPTALWHIGSVGHVLNLLTGFWQSRNTARSRPDVINPQCDNDDRSLCARLPSTPPRGLQLALRFFYERATALFSTSHLPHHLLEGSADLNSHFSRQSRCQRHRVLYQEPPSSPTMPTPRVSEPVFQPCPPGRTLNTAYHLSLRKGILTLCVLPPFAFSYRHQAQCHQAQYCHQGTLTRGRPYHGSKVLYLG